MRISTRPVSLTFAMLVAILMIIVGPARLVSENHRQAFVEVTASLYPGYTGAENFPQVIIGALYGVLDGAVGGVVLNWLYNQCSRWPLGGWTQMLLIEPNIDFATNTNSNI
jgi:hypothetical protein